MMYVIQTKSGCEVTAGDLLRKNGYDIKMPEKLMYIRRKGTWNIEKKLVFGGYIFLEIADEITPEDYYAIKSTSGVINFVGRGKPQMLSENECKYIEWLWNNGKPIEASKVYVGTDGQKMVMSGPLRRYGGKYASMDIRQRRAKIAVTICGVIRHITLPIEII